ncbi:MAG TPA: tetratricopeptide repeat protein [Kofleriaceae bacterium]|nr:tetratricopeptide repeat protein [Kofleriaceae bacterium]
MFGRKAKIRKAVARALAPVIGEQDLADHTPIEALPVELQPTAYFTLAHALVDDERFTAARHVVDRALALAPEEIDLHKLAASIHRELGDLAAAIAAQRRVVAGAPREIAPAMALAELLISTEQLDEAIALLRSFAHVRDREVDARLAEALFVRGESKEALAILEVICEQYEAQLREPWSVTDRQGLISRAQHAHRLRSDVYAELHGREATIELAAAAGRLDARAGVNYRLLGARLASSSERVAEVLELQDPDATEKRGQAYGPKSALGLALVGTSQLRRGELAAARKSFERASELDGRCFAAFLGLGAVLDHDRYDLHRRAETLPVAETATLEIEKVVPDWPALTEIERRVVSASIRPFGALVPRLAERAVKMRILPIDVRATDIGLFEHIAGKRASDDHRSYDALSGVATPRGAIAKVEELLNIASEHSWTFAHEFAHLVYFHLDDARAAPFAALYERARRIGYANTDYALKNDDELFAVSYTDYLRRRHGFPGAPMADDAGVQDALMSYFRDLCG